MTAAYLLGAAVAYAYVPPATKRNHPWQTAGFVVAWPAWACFFGVAYVVQKVGAG